MIKLHKDYRIREKSLNKEESKVFFMFLTLEKVRHQQNIDFIDKTLKFLVKKYKFDIKEIMKLLK